MKIPDWSDSDILQGCFIKFEQAVKCQVELRSKWGELLPIHLTGKAQTAFEAVEEPEILNNYYVIKENLLKTPGDIPQNADRHW